MTRKRVYSVEFAKALLGSVCKDGKWMAILADTLYNNRCANGEKAADVIRKIKTEMGTQSAWPEMKAMGFGVGAFRERWCVCVMDNKLIRACDLKRYGKKCSKYGTGRTDVTLHFYDWMVSGIGKQEAAYRVFCEYRRHVNTRAIYEQIKGDAEDAAY